jgi:tetratricopeptide (TPR) repeat protein
VRGSEPAAAAVPPDMLEKLGALGYVSPGGVSTERASGADPKDKIEEYKTLNTLMREGLVGLREKRYADSLARFRSLFGHGVDSFESHYYAARALTGLERWREAAVHYEGAITKLPSYAAAYLGLADTYLADGKVDQALDAVRRGQKVAPDDPRLIEREGDIERRKGAAKSPLARSSAWRRWPRATRSCGSSWERCTAIWGGSRTPPG